MSDGETEICPACGCTRLRSRNPRAMSSSADSAENYRCSTCGHLFDDPDTRPKQQTSRAGMGSTTTAKLAQMEPDDVPALRGGDD